MPAIAYLEISLQIPHAQSLKEKRRCIKSLKDKLQSRFNASVAEIDAMDSWQHAVFGVVMIANDKQYLQTQVSHLENHLLTLSDMVVLNTRMQWL